MSSTTMYLAELQTSHYTFRALGRTKALAKNALRSSWQRWRRMSGAGDWSEFDDSVNVYEMNLGNAYCDGQEI